MSLACRLKPRAACPVVLTCALALLASKQARALPGDMPDLDARSLEDHPVPSTPSDYLHHEVGWALFVYPREARGTIEPLIESANEVRRTLREELGQPVLAHIEVRVAPDTVQMAGLAPDGLPPPAGAVGVAYPRYRLIVLSTRSPDGSVPRLEAVYRHQLGHVALFDAVRGHRLPPWFHEGYGVHVSGDGSWTRASTLWKATLSEGLMPLSQLETALGSEGAQAELAHAQAADFVRFMLRPRDHDHFRQLVGRVAQGEGFYPSLEVSYGVPLRSLEREWRSDLGDRHGGVPVIAAGAVLSAMVLLMGALWLRRHRARRDAPARGQRTGEKMTPDKRLPVVRVTLTPRAPVESVELASLRHDKPRDVPKVEHDGKWHTLH